MNSIALVLAVLRLLYSATSVPPSPVLTSTVAAGLKFPPRNKHDGFAEEENVAHRAIAVRFGLGAGDFRLDGRPNRNRHGVALNAVTCHHKRMRSRIDPGGKHHVELVETDEAGRGTGIIDRHRIAIDPRLDTRTHIPTAIGRILPPAPSRRAQ